MEVNIYFLSGKEVHMVGDYVGVVWNTTSVKKQIKGEDGLVYTAVAQERHGEPYIDFLTIRCISFGEYYEDDDSPAQGGMSRLDAVKMADELNKAVEYLNSL